MTQQAQSTCAIIDEILELAKNESADKLFELNAATLYPELYDRAAAAFDAWDAALATALVLLATQSSTRATPRTRNPRQDDEEQVACKADEDLAIITSRGRVQRVPATAFARMGRPAKGDPQIDLIGDEVVLRLVALPCGGDSDD